MVIPVCTSKYFILRVLLVNPQQLYIAEVHGPGRNFCEFLKYTVGIVPGMIELNWESIKLIYRVFFLNTAAAAQSSTRIPMRH